MRAARALVLLLLLAWPASSGEDLVDVANAFAAAYHDWAAFKQRELEKPGTGSAPAMLRWRVVEHRWRRLERAVREQ